MADNRTCAENQRHCTRYTSSSSSAAICGLPTRWRIPEMDMSFCCNTPVLLVAKVGGERREAANGDEFGRLHGARAIPEWLYLGQCGYTNPRTALKARCRPRAADSGACVADVVTTLRRPHHATRLTAARLARQYVGQRTFNAIHFFANHPDRLVIGGMRHGRDGFHCVTNLVVPVPDQIDPRGGLHSVLIDLSDQLGDHPGEG